MRLLTGFCLLSLVGCSPSTPTASPPSAPVVSASPSAPEPAAPVTSAQAKPPASPAVCLPPEVNDVEIATTSLEGSRLTICLKAQLEGAQGFPCLSVDLGTRALAAAPSIPIETPAAPEVSKPTTGPTVTSTAREVKVCVGDAKGCKTIRPGGGKLVSGGHGDSGSDGLIASLSSDGSKLAVLVAERDPRVPESHVDSRRVFVEVHDVARQKRLSRTPIPPGSPERMGLFSDHSDIWTVRWVGSEHLHLGAHRCCGPAGAEAILALKKGTITPIGDPDLVRELKPGLWLIGNSDNGLREDDDAISLSLLHLDTDKITRLKLPARSSNEAEGHDLEAYPWRGSVWAIAHTTPPGVAWLDIEQEKIVDHLNLPQCK